MLPWLSPAGQAQRYLIQSTWLHPQTSLQEWRHHTAFPRKKPWLAEVCLVPGWQRQSPEGRRREIDSAQTSLRAGSGWEALRRGVRWWEPGAGEDMRKVSPDLPAWAGGLSTLGGHWLSECRKLPPCLWLKVWLTFYPFKVKTQGYTQAICVYQKGPFFHLPDGQEGALWRTRAYSTSPTNLASSLPAGWAWLHTLHPEIIRTLLKGWHTSSGAFHLVLEIPEMVATSELFPFLGKNDVYPGLIGHISAIFSRNQPVT